MPWRSSPLGAPPSRSSEVTSAPESSRDFASHEPANPRAPATSAFTGRATRSRLPEVVEHHRVLIGVHAVPESRVPVGAQLARRRKALQRLSLEHAVLGQIVEDARLEAEEAPVDPALDPRLLVEAPHQSLIVEI